jgi:hypothetical protein
VEFIRAVNDSSAIIDAYRKFYSLQKVQSSLKSPLPLIKDFRLTDPEGEEIKSTITKYPGIENELAQIRKLVEAMELPSTKNESEENGSSITVDSSRIKDLSKYFSKKKDEFKTPETFWIEPKTTTQYRNRNSLHCYFATVDGVPDNFRFVFQYFADDWLFIRNLKFNIDGDVFEYSPIKMERDNGDGNIWEWFDDPILTTKDLELVERLSKAKKVKIRLNGDQYYKDKTISAEQLQSIARTIEYYKAMGGTF